MRNLLLSSLFIVVLFGCNLGHYNSLKPVNPNSNTPPSPLFGDNFESFLFKTNIKVYGKEFSGLLVTKQIQPNDYRVIFTTELGMKLFDFGFKDTSFTLHYCVPQFNKPKLLNIIKEDIEILLMNSIKNKPVIDLKGKSHLDHPITIEQTVKKVKINHYHYYYFYKQIEGNKTEIYKIEKAKKRIKKTTFLLNSYENNTPNNISIQHHNIRLRIELNKLKKE